MQPQFFVCFEKQVMFLNTLICLNIKYKLLRKMCLKTHYESFFNVPSDQTHHLDCYFKSTSIYKVMLMILSFLAFMKNKTQHYKQQMFK